MRNKWKSLSRWKKGLVIFLVLFIIASMSNGTNEVNDNSSNQIATSNESTQDGEKDGKDNAEEKTSSEQFDEIAGKLLSSNLIEIEHKDNEHINIYIKTLGMSEKSDYRSSLRDVSKLIEETQDLDYGSIYIEYRGAVIDKYGESRDEKLITYDFSRETIDKLNFENFNFKNIPIVADNHWVSPIIAKSL